MIVLDTSYIIDYLRGVDAARDLVGDGDEIAITVVTYHEIMTGLKRKKRRREEKILRRFLSEIRILPFDINAADESSSIAARLMAVGKAVNALAILIAGIAIASGAEKIITGDSDFLEIAKVSNIEVVLYGRG